MRHILRCEVCCIFTMKEVCGCNRKTAAIRPQKYSSGKYAEYRRKARSEELKRKNLL